MWEMELFQDMAPMYVAARILWGGREVEYRAALEKAYSVDMMPASAFGPAPPQEAPTLMKMPSWE